MEKDEQQRPDLANAQCEAQVEEVICLFCQEFSLL